MENQSGDIIATVEFLHTKAGGRKDPTPPLEHRCIITIDNKDFSVRLNLREVGNVPPGKTIKIPINFLYLDLAKQHCSIGKRFSLREATKIADGIIEEILF